MNAKCSDPKHSERKGAPGWIDGTLAIVEGALRDPGLVCAGCAAAQAAAATKPIPTLEDRLADIERRLAALDKQASLLERSK
jgi:hypothetical protein